MSLFLYLTIICLLYPEFRTEKNNEDDAYLKPYDLPAQWVEEMDIETGQIINMDIFFDRTVMIGVEPALNTQPNIISTGVLFDSEHVLTSYNPLRKVLKDGTDNIVVAILTGRMYNSTLRQYTRRVEYYSFVCHRQIVVVPESSIPPELWHGDDKRNSPLHDLLVIRINRNLTLLDPEPDLYSFGYISTSQFTKVGPVITPLAKKKDWLGFEVKFASLGFRDKEHMLSYNMLSTREYLGDNVIVDCDEWLLRDWGHFICVKNDDLYEGIGSGTLLIYEYKLFGIGSFTIKRGNGSILVFTDIRPYRETISKICVDEIELYETSDEEIITKEPPDTFP